MKFTFPNLIRLSAKREGDFIWWGRSRPYNLTVCEKSGKTLVEWTRANCGQYVFELSLHFYDDYSASSTIEHQLEMTHFGIRKIT